MTSQEVTDKFYLVYFIIFLQGSGCLFPMNAFISAPDYFNRVYGDGTLMYFSAASSAPNFLMLFVMLKVGPYLPLWSKTVIPYFITLIVLATIPVLGFLQIAGTLGFCITLAGIVVTSICNGILQSAIFGLVGMLPPIYTQAAMSGIGLSAVSVCILRVITKLTIEPIGKEVSVDRMNLSVAIYFFVSAAMVAVCSLSFIIAIRSPFVKYRISLTTPSTPPTRYTETTDILQDINSGRYSTKRKEATVFGVFKKIWHICLLVITTFSITSSISPSLTSSLETNYPHTFMKYWLNLIVVSVTSSFDMIGRTLPRFITLFKDQKIGIPILVRVVFLPLFVLCNYPRVIIYDPIPIVFAALFSLSGGYLASSSMMIIPTLVEPQERELAGMISNVCLLFGIFLGSMIGFGFGSAVGL